MTRALLAMDAATCLKVDGDDSAAADAAADVWQLLPLAYRDGLIRSRADALHQSLVQCPQQTWRRAGQLNTVVYQALRIIEGCEAQVY
ncbi:hypothetical protein [Streptomyces tubercidicus]|uniref:hypothetical protein n=1 Tax=Streptomyces tubercidicus TaxID=47759 RepID=UPI00346727C3